MVSSIEDFRSPYFWRSVAAELLGTLILVFVGCASCLEVEGGSFAAPSVVQIALCFGLAVGTVVWAIAHASGGHINPAVTLAMLVTRKISLIRGILYVVAQCIGAIAGAAAINGATLTSRTNVNTSLGLTLPYFSTQLNKNVNLGQAFGIEFLITFVLVFTVFATVDSKRTDLNGSGPLAIGLSVTLCHLAFVPYTGASMNPARSFGPALILNNWDKHWLYWVGPCLGGLVAGIIYDNVFAANASLSRAQAYLLSSKYNGDTYDAGNTEFRKQEPGPSDYQSDPESVKITFHETKEQ